MPDLDRERRIFEQVVDLAGDARDTRLGELCGGDPELLARLRALLRAHDGAAGLSAVPGAAGPLEEDDPERIGPYKILERIGEGGMGVVYLAEQERPLRRRVAVKIIKVGMDTKEVIARFETERQALALMNHPNIARILDAGATERGRPYFVMEHVPGLPLTEYADAKRLDLEPRLRLFLQVAGAVQHAHQRGVIHRDLKPTNLLVAEEDGGAVPKVIDFGVAKATHLNLSHHTLHTRAGNLVGTPEYMSPEQADLNALDVDTRSDVYSLGVVLYELLTGALPFDPERLPRLGLAEIQRTIREVDPPRPSVRVQEMAAASLPNGPDPRLRARQLRGELDWIVMKAVDKDRMRRYQSVGALHRDVERYLADLPVQAGPPSAAYRLNKFVKRHRTMTLSVAGALLAVVLGVAGLALGLLDAREARRLADRRADNATVATDFLQKALFHVDPEYGGGRLSLIEVIDLAARSIEEDLGGHPEVEASVRESIGVAYRRLSLFSEAAPHLRRSLELRRELLGDTSTQTARSFIAMAYLRFEHEGKTREPLDLLDKAGAGFAANGLSGTFAEAWLLLDIGIINLAADRLDAAEDAFARSARLLTAERGADHPDVSRPLRGLATVAWQRGRVAEAESMAREAVRLSEGEGHDYIGARAKLVLARVLVDTGDFDEAGALLRETGAVFERLVGPRHVRTGELDACLAELHLRRGELAEADRVTARCEAMRRAILDPQHWAVLEAALLRNRARIGLGEAQAAEPALLAISEESDRLLGNDHPLSIAVAEARLQCAVALGDESLRTIRAERLATMHARRAARLGGLEPGM